MMGSAGERGGFDIPVRGREAPGTVQSSGASGVQAAVRVSPLLFAWQALVRPAVLLAGLAARPPMTARQHLQVMVPVLIVAALSHGVVLELVRPEPLGWQHPRVLGPVLRIVILGGLAVMVAGVFVGRIAALFGSGDRDGYGLTAASVAAVPLLVAFIANPLPLPWGRIVVLAGFVWAAVLLWRADGHLLRIRAPDRPAHLVAVLTAFGVAVVAVGWPLTAAIPGPWG